MVIGKFMVGKEKHVVVKMDHATHTMPKADWKRLYGNLHPEKWKKEKREYCIEWRWIILDSKSKGKISESQSRMLTSMGIIEYLAKNNLSKEQAAYSAYMDQSSKIITKRMDAMEYLKTKIDTLETFDL